MLSDLPRDLAEEVLIRLPMTSNRAVRSVCKKWSTLSKARRFTMQHIAQAAAAREFMVVMVISHRVYLMSLNLEKGVEPSVNRQGKLISLDDSDRLDICQVYYCDGLLFCLPFDETRFVVWNPYSGQNRWFKLLPRRREMSSYKYAIGYEESKSGRSYKVLRCGDCSSGYVEHELYYINSKDATVPITTNPDWLIECTARGVSLKGNTYWFAQQETPPDLDDVNIAEVPDFLICFDFTTESFGPHLALPFHSLYDDTVTLSSVRDEQLAVLHQQQDTFCMEIWITTKIEPQAVSWSKLCFLAVDMKPLIGYQFEPDSASFFVDEFLWFLSEFLWLSRVVDLFEYPRQSEMDTVAYIIGEDGYFKKEHFGGSSDMLFRPRLYPFVPSLAQIKLGGKRKRKRKRLQDV
ncbi:unnamed protein product [Microthlaspi erraticum]|uniref:F-box domain-containing protein n=1 Tax=Microthlaspi erraticum TaxID=1685480 RepID=A0A6D2KLD1_9BRAS|nr:unnamed protein product [Microthlaspi erraticum]